MSSTFYEYDENGRYFLDKFGNKIYKFTDDSPEQIRVNNKMVPVRRVDDEFKVILDTEGDDQLELIVQRLNKALVSGLAEVFMQKPRDPVDHLAHFLLLQRYNELCEIANEK